MTGVVNTQLLLQDLDVSVQHCLPLKNCVLLHYSSSFPVALDYQILGPAVTVLTVTSFFDGTSFGDNCRQTKLSTRGSLKALSDATQQQHHCTSPLFPLAQATMTFHCIKQNSPNRRQRLFFPFSKREQRSQIEK